jgi:HD-GYP domain-containing protein (c-di-GMP phosphodiesterase class II)
VTEQLIRLRGLTPPVEGRSWESGRGLRVGRREGCEVGLDAPSISRFHAELTPTGRGWVVSDLGSTNGTFLNGARVGRVGEVIKEGDVLQFGSICMLVTTALHGRARPSGVGGLRPTLACLAEWNDLPALLTPETAPSLAALVRTGRDFLTHESLEAFLESILWETAELFLAPEAAFILRDRRTNSLQTRTALHAGTKGPRKWERCEPVLQALSRAESLLYETVSERQLGEEPAEDGAGARCSLICAALRSPHRQLGVLCLVRPAGHAPFAERDLRLADALALAVSTTIDGLDHLLAASQAVVLETLGVLGELLAFRDDATGSHSQRVTDYALMMAEELGVSEPDRYSLRIGAPLHDLWKVGVPDRILQKAGPLTEEEMELVRSQLARGADLLESVPSLAQLTPIVRYHRERWDGTGYPDGLAGPRIPLLARIVGLAGAFDAMTTDRPHRRALPFEEALAEVRRGVGTQFDPDCVAALLRLRGRFEDRLRERNGLPGTLSREELAQVLGTMGLSRNGRDSSIRSFPPNQPTPRS